MPGDRVPFLPVFREFAAKYAGYTFREALFDDDKYVASQIKCMEDFNTVAVWDPGVVPFFAELMGGRLITPEDDAPASEPTAITRENLTPLDLSNSPSLRSTLNKLKKLKKEVGTTHAVLGYLPLPFRFAAEVRGMQKVMLDMLLDPSLVRALQECYITFATSYAQELMAAGADLVYLTNPLANKSCISRKHYVELVHPYSTELFKMLRQSGIMTIFHTCGNWSDRLDLVVDDGPNCIWVDKADLRDLKRSFGSKVCIMGNVDVTATLLQGSTEDVVRETTNCLGAMGNTGGYILSGSCLLGRDTPTENVHAMEKVLN
jgi:MtaA/CmuA family methyltransferase